MSVTPFGRTGTRAHEPATDLTLLAGGGPVWSCGYDDHSLPPVRGGGNQAFHIGSTFAVLGALTAVLARDVTGTRPARRREHARRGQRHHRVRQLRVAGGAEHGAAPDRPARVADDQHAQPDALRRRPLRDHRLPPAQPARIRGAGRLVGDARPPRRSSPTSCCSTSRSSAAASRSPSSAPTPSRSRSSGPDAKRCASSPNASPPTTSSSADRRAGSRAGWSRHRRRRSNPSTSWPAASRWRSSTRTSDARTATRRAIPHARVTVAHLPARAPRRRTRPRDPRRRDRWPSITVFRSRCATTYPTTSRRSPPSSSGPPFPGFVDFKEFTAPTANAGGGDLRVGRGRGCLAQRCQHRDAQQQGRAASTRSTTSRCARWCAATSGRRGTEAALARMPPCSSSTRPTSSPATTKTRSRPRSATVGCPRSRPATTPACSGTSTSPTAAAGRTAS